MVLTCIFFFPLTKVRDGQREWYARELLDASALEVPPFPTVDSSDDAFEVRGSKYHSVLCELRERAAAENAISAGNVDTARLIPRNSELYCAGDYKNEGKGRLLSKR